MKNGNHFWITKLSTTQLLNQNLEKNKTVFESENQTQVIIDIIFNLKKQKYFIGLKTFFIFSITDRARINITEIYVNKNQNK